MSNSILVRFDLHKDRQGLGCFFSILRPFQNTVTTQQYNYLIAMGTIYKCAT